MRYIHQFDIPEEVIAHTKNEEDLKARKKYHFSTGSARLGQMMGEDFGFVKQPKYKINGGETWKIELQVFSIEDWIRFKYAVREKIFSIKQRGYPIMEDIEHIVKMIQILEESENEKQEQRRKQYSSSGSTNQP